LATPQFKDIFIAKRV